MAALSTSGIASLLIEKVQRIVEDGIEKKDVTFSRVEKSPAQSTNSLGVRMPVLVEDNASEEWRSSEGADFAPSDAEVYKNLSITYTRVYKTCEFTADVAQLDKDPDKIVGIIANSVAKGTMKLKKSLNRMFFGDGSGSLATYSSGTGTTSIVFLAPFGARKLDARARIQFYDSTLATVRNSGQVFTVVSRDNSTRTAVLDAAPTLSASDVAVFANSVSASINGLGNIIANSGSIHGLSRSTYPALNSTVVSASSAALSASLLDQLNNTMAYKTGMEKQDGMVLIWSPAQRQAYLNLGYELKQFVRDSGAGAGNLDLSFDGITHAGIPTITDVDCPDASIFMVNFDALKRFQLLPVGPVKNESGTMLFQRNASSGQGHSDGFNVYLAGKLQIGAPNPRMVGAKLTTLSTSGVPSGNIS
jgi:hypothetical protein